MKYYATLYCVFPIDVGQTSVSSCEIKWYSPECGMVVSLASSSSSRDAMVTGALNVSVMARLG